MAIERIRKLMKNAEIKKEAFKAGYRYTGYATWKCDACEEDMLKLLKGVDTIPLWANAHHALKFTKKGTIAIACRCGWRNKIKVKHPAHKTRCKVRGCNHLVGKDDTDGVCQPCRKEIAGGGNPATYSQFCTLKPKKGCMHYMQGSNDDCVRTKCNKYDPIAAAMKPHLKVCNRKACNNPVPKGRTSVCYSCQPPAKEPASSKVIM